MSAKITLARAWDWTRLGSPGGGHGAYSLVVDPASDERIVVTTDEGIHASELGPNGVLIWTNTLPGSARALVADPWRPGTLLAASNHDAGQADDCQGYRCLYRSEDWGWTWTLTQRFAQTITSILVSPVDPSTLLVGCNFTEDDPPVGLYLCSASGDSCGLSSFGIDDQVIYLADIAQDDSPTTSNGTIYVSSERHSAPRPYPPFLRSTDYGASWKNLTFRPDNHVMKIETHPQDGRVYAPEEGSQLFISTNQGDSWQIRNNAYFQTTMLLDRRRPHRLYGGSIAGQGVDGVRFSPDGGLTFSNAGLAGVVVSRLALSGSGWVLFAAAYDRDGNDGGVFRSHMDYCPPGVTDDGPVDTDGDGLGDACDSDLDGDGIPNEFDCAPRNRCLGPDLDRDTVCDGWGTHPETGLLCDEPACLYDCGLMYARLGPGAFHLGRCLAECQAPMDNCISPGPAADSDCAAVAASCSSALSETPCDRAAAERCALRYGNPGQESSFGDPLVGDKCKTGIGSLTLSPDYGGGTGFGGGLPVTAVCDRYGDTYS
ncbi:MAG: thrombospondin type 3 repeat-containing protein, partial [Polyangia bacterium]|nr:thrombospondin type 3 repeat-containing protein [Polyangia bacterium]